MASPDFNLLARQLLKNGISPRLAHRAVNELRDHYDDLVEAALQDGVDALGARDHAKKRLGEFDDIVRDMASRRELKTWAFRYPRVAVVVYPLACLAVLPAIPVFAGIAHRTTLMRWFASFLAAGFVTAAIMLIMQLSIILG